MVKKMLQPENNTKWLTTTNPLNIVFLGWASLALQARQGSGYNLTASELASGLALSGHKVYHLNSGRSYTFVPSTYIQYQETWRNVECYALFNSPNLSPGPANFGNLQAETSSVEQTKIVLEWLDKIRAHIVHIHSLEGFSLDLISAIRETGRIVVVTPHDYWFVCPHVNLLYEGVHLCMDYKGGQNCVSCIKNAPHWKLKLKQAILQTIERNLGTDFINLIHAVIHILNVKSKQILKSNKSNKNNKNKLFTQPYKPDPEISLGFDVTDADTHNGLIEHNIEGSKQEQEIKIEIRPLDTNEKFLNSNVHTVVSNQFGERRIAGVTALNNASVLIPPSDFMRKAYISMGVREKQTQVVRLGLPHLDQINRKARRSPFYNIRPWEPNSAKRPLRIAFLGTIYPTKGLEVLVSAIPLLPKEIRQRCQFIIRASGNDWTFRKRLSSYPEVSFFAGYDILQLIALSGEYDVGILPHLWFENSPIVLLEHLHAGKFVIASRLGGPVEWINPPQNGLLFPAGQALELAKCISKLVTGEVSIPSPKEIHELSPLQSYPDHVKEVQSIYYELLQAEKNSPLFTKEETLSQYPIVSK